MIIHAPSQASVRRFQSNTARSGLRAAKGHATTGASRRRVDVRGSMLTLSIIRLAEVGAGYSSEPLPLVTVHELVAGRNEP